ncbi:hypothetical protein BDY21DRAFT_338134 [Lineolata rhizophorae]|uniref:Uncharacterized protein n=1 Tax=Lineolata rhizophorae TaxID=578093 RepID=A0A6A6P5W8_9PEZI|nr:hypothetical protein BDY21DRAFT_338134 [Lineolata rhizophorae]
MLPPCSRPRDDPRLGPFPRRRILPRDGPWAFATVCQPERERSRRQRTGHATSGHTPARTHQTRSSPVDQGAEAQWPTWHASALSRGAPS